MDVLNEYCSSCGFQIEPDCDFCPGCGRVRSKIQPAEPPLREAYSWMPGPTAPVTQPTSTAIARPTPVQIQYIPPPTTQVTSESSGLATAARTLGIISISVMVVGLIPCLGWLNYANFVLASVTFWISIAALASAKSESARNSAMIGLLLAIIADGTGVVRLIIGGGCV